MDKKMADHVVDDEVEDDELIDQVFPISCPTSTPMMRVNTRRKLSERKPKKFWSLKENCFTDISSFVEGTWLLTVCHLVIYITMN